MYTLSSRFTDKLFYLSHSLPVKQEAHLSYFRKGPRGHRIAISLLHTQIAPQPHMGSELKTTKWGHYKENGSF